MSDQPQVSLTARAVLSALRGNENNMRQASLRGQYKPFVKTVYIVYHR